MGQDLRERQESVSPADTVGHTPHTDTKHVTAAAQRHTLGHAKTTACSEEEENKGVGEGAREGVWEEQAWQRLCGETGGGGPCGGAFLHHREGEKRQNPVFVVLAKLCPGKKRLCRR